MATRKRKNDEELVALPSDESEEEEEYVTIPPLLPTRAAADDVGSCGGVQCSFTRLRRAANTMTGPAGRARRLPVTAESSASLC
jgi:hypothetical protein